MYSKISKATEFVKNHATVFVSTTSAKCSLAARTVKIAARTLSSAMQNLAAAIPDINKKKLLFERIVIPIISYSVGALSYQAILAASGEDDSPAENSICAFFVGFVANAVIYSITDAAVGDTYRHIMIPYRANRLTSIDLARLVLLATTPALISIGASRAVGALAAPLIGQTASRMTVLCATTAALGVVPEKLSRSINEIMDGAIRDRSRAGLWGMYIVQLPIVIYATNKAKLSQLTTAIMLLVGAGSFLQSQFPNHNDPKRGVDRRPCFKEKIFSIVAGSVPGAIATSMGKDIFKSLLTVKFILPIAFCRTVYSQISRSKDYRSLGDLWRANELAVLQREASSNLPRFCTQ